MKTDATTDEEFLRQLLDESDVPSSDTLHESLLELRAAGSAQVAAPSAELAAFMSPKVTPLRPRRRAAKGAMIGVAVAAATGLGVTGVAAASPEFRSAADQTVQQVASFFNNDDGAGSPVQQTTVVNPGQDDSEDEDTDEGTAKEHRPPAEDSDAGSTDSSSDESGTGSAGTSRSDASPSKRAGPTRSEGVPSLDGRPNQDGAQPDLSVPEMPGDKILPKNLDDQPGEDKLPLPENPKPPTAPQKTDPAAIPDLPVLPESAVDDSK